ncbi:MAG TPA: acetolactate synthase small subunit [bacterium]
MNEKHTITCLVENHFGVLARVSGLISARAFNIDSLTVSATEDPSVSLMTIVVDADALKLEQVKRQLGRLVDVIEVRELREGEYVNRELLLARLNAPDGARDKMEELARRSGAKLFPAHGGAVILEATGTTRDLDALVGELRAYGLTNLARTGRVALPR